MSLSCCHAACHSSMARCNVDCVFAYFIKLHKVDFKRILHNALANIVASVHVPVCVRPCASVCVCGVYLVNIHACSSWCLQAHK